EGSTLPASMERRVVNPWTWQDRLGFVQATEVTQAERVLYCAGQTSVDGDGRPVHADDLESQVGQALDNLETVLREAGYELADDAEHDDPLDDADAVAAPRELLAFAAHAAQPR